MLHVTGLSFMAAPESEYERLKRAAPTFVYAQLGNQQVVVACLTWGVCETMRVELFFERSVTFFVSEDGSPVQLTGCVLGKVETQESAAAAGSSTEDSDLDNSSTGSSFSSMKRAAPETSPHLAPSPPSKRPRAKGRTSSSSESSGSDDNSSGSDSSSSDDNEDSVSMSPGDKLAMVIRTSVKNGRDSVYIEDVARAYKSRFAMGFRDEAGQKLSKFLKKDARFASVGTNQWKLSKA
jgi:hypothetical protein